MKTFPLFLMGVAGALLCLLTSEGKAQQETIGPGRYRFTALAGGPGTKGYVDGIGTAARFDNPRSIVVDGSGNVYVSEQNACTIRRISPDGAVTTFAGMPGQPGSQDGTGSAARFKSPSGLAVDGAGNIFVADTGNFTIRKISGSGVVTTVAGTAGVAGGRDGAVAEALFENPQYVGVDAAGNLFVTETYPHSRIRKITREGTVSTLNLTLPEQYGGSIEVWISDLCVDREGNLYAICFDGWDFIDAVRFTRTSADQYAPGIVLQPPAPVARWSRVSGIAIDGADTLYVKYGTDPIGRFGPGGATDARYSFGGSGGYLWTGFAVDQRGRLFTLPYRYYDKSGMIEVGTFDPAATGLSIVGQPFDDDWEAGGQGSLGFGVTAAGAPTFTYQWTFNSNPIPGATTSALWLSNATAGNAGFYSVVVGDSDGSASVASRSAKLEIVRIPPSAPLPSAPIFTLPGGALKANAGETITLTAPARNSSEQTLQWLKDGQPIAGATADTLVLSTLQTSDTATYTVVISHVTGTTARAVFTVEVIAAPVITRQPFPIAVVPGSTAAFNVGVVSNGELSYQWRHDGRDIFAATGAMLAISNASQAGVGGYSVAITNAAGTTFSEAAALTLSDETNFGHLTNLSVRARITAGDPSIAVGTVIRGGAGRAMPLLVRAVGPSLAAMGVGAPLSDPRLELRAGSSVIAENDDWGGDALLRNVAAAVGAFPVAENSKDAVIFSPNLIARDYTIGVNAVGGATGDVLAELFDASVGFDGSAPRLVNVSVLKRLEATEILTVGFVVGGRTARTVLLRANGRTLTAFNVADPMLDPQLALFDSAQTKVAENDDWNGDAQLAGASTGIASFRQSYHQDAALLVTLAPGNYTAQIRGKGNGGAVLLEIYEVP